MRVSFGDGAEGRPRAQGEGRTGRAVGGADALREADVVERVPEAAAAVRGRLKVGEVDL